MPTKTTKKNTAAKKKAGSMKAGSESRATPPTLHPIRVGQAYLFRSVTHYHLGRVAEIHHDCFVLADASWVADTGRFHTALNTGTLNEVEPFPAGCIVFRGGLVDATPWPHALPRGAI